jgi:hypothetical protein
MENSISHSTYNPELFNGILIQKNISPATTDTTFYWSIKRMTFIYINNIVIQYLCKLQHYNTSPTYSEKHRREIVKSIYETILNEKFDNPSSEWITCKNTLTLTAHQLLLHTQLNESQVASTALKEMCSINENILQLFLDYQLIQKTENNTIYYEIIHIEQLFTEFMLHGEEGINKIFNSI